MERRSGGVTICLMILNILIYMSGGLRLIPGVPEAIRDILSLIPMDYESGGIYAPAIAQGEWWRIITFFFIHGGFQHLLYNMFALYAIGFGLEKRMGHIRYAATYLLAGVGSGLVIYGWDSFTGVAHMTVGASGAIFGLMGGMLAISLNKEDGMPGVSIRRLIIACVLMLIPTSENVSVSGHVGGLISGFIAACIIGKVFPVREPVETLDMMLDKQEKGL